MVGVGQVALHQLFLHQVLDPADLHVVRIVHQTRPDGALVGPLHGLRLDGDVGGGRVVVRRGDAVATVAEAEALESRRGAGEGSTAALAGHRPKVSVNLSGERPAGTGSKFIHRNDSLSRNEFFLQVKKNNAHSERKYYYPSVETKDTILTSCELL